MSIIYAAGRPPKQLYNRVMEESTFKTMLHKKLNLYVCGITVLAILYGYLVFGETFTFPDWWVWVLGSASLLLVWQCGLRMPYLGMISMERLIHFHLLLTLPVSETILITTVSSLIMPFINKAYRLNSYQIAALRAVNNIAMNTIMLLSGYLVLAWGMDLPLQGIDWQDAFVLALAAVVMQVINMGMIFIYFVLDHKKISKMLTPAYLFADFVFVPAGVLSALLIQTADPEVFYLFSFFMLVLLISFYGFNQRLAPEEANSIKQGTEYTASYLDLKHVLTAITTRCDQLFDCQAMFLIEVDSKSAAPRFLINLNETKFHDLPELAAKYFTDDAVVKGKLKIEDHTVHFMVARFIDRSGVFAQMMLVRVNQIPFQESDLDLLRLFVQRYRPGLSYAITYERLSEYKDNLEYKVSERTRQLETVNEEKSELVNRLKKISNSDALTQLFNRRYFNGLMKFHQKKPPKQLSLAIIDIDHFKKINDSYGHDTGDHVLKVVAKIMSQWATSRDTLVRYGGEEFVVVGQNTPASQVNEKLSRLVELVETHDWSKISLDSAITISIGCAHYPDANWTELFECADKALYRAKTSGRNQLQVHQNPSPSPRGGSSVIKC